MKCPLCGNDTLVSEVREVSYTYLGRTTVFTQDGDHCSSCGESIFTGDQGDSYSEHINHFRAQVDSEPLPSEEIRKIRKRLKLTQKDAGEIFGGGIRAFSQYERNKSRPNKAAETLLKLLNRHPELLEEIRGRNAA